MERRRQTGEATAVWSAIGLAVVVLGGVWAVAHIAAAIDGVKGLPMQPVVLIGQLVKGQAKWPPSSVPVAIGLGAVLLLLAGTVAVLVSRRRGRRLRGDQAARDMGHGAAVAGMNKKAAAAKAKRLGIAGPPGLTIAANVADGRKLYQDWEDVSVDIWGPRQGKTTSRVIPAIIDAPGAVVVTSNKRDVVDATRGVRESNGPVYAFDPQMICNEQPTWWWNPLSYVTDEVQAANMARVLMGASRDGTAQKDAYFDTAGEILLSGMLLAAAVSRRPITYVYTWLTNSHDDEPALILKQAGYDREAEAVASAVRMPEKQRAGVFGTAMNGVGFLSNRAAMVWCTPQDGDDGPYGREEFDVRAFVRSTGTLYSISKEGKGTAAPIVTMLTVAVSEAAEEYAQQSPGGRVPIPLVLVLDEAANVCRWGDLPDLYSHFGSRGIPVLTILQSWSQGVSVWGEAGMKKLWGAATVKVIGSSVSDTDFLRGVSDAIGEIEIPQVSTSYSSRQNGGRSRSVSSTYRRILDVSDLVALPKGRCIVLSGGARPVLARTLPWMNGPAAPAIRASISRYDPTAAVAPSGPSAPTQVIGSSSPVQERGL